MDPTVRVKEYDEWVEDEHPGTTAEGGRWVTKREKTKITLQDAYTDVAVLWKHCKMTDDGWAMDVSEQV